jgi:transposase InsO family protein
MTDNAFSYVRNRSRRELLARHAIPRLTTPGLPTAHQRQHWLDYYNRLRAHSSLGGRPPMSRVHNICG